MTLYLEQKLTSPDPLGIHIEVVFHLREPLIAVASYSQARGGYVTLFDESGDACEDVGDPLAQVTLVRWHPTRKLLATGWDSGQVRLWTGQGPLGETAALHRAPVCAAEWDNGARLVTADLAGCLVAWKLDPQGHLESVFLVELQQVCTALLFREAVTPDVSGLARAAVAGDNAALDLFSDWRPRTAARLPLPGASSGSPGVFACCHDATFHVGPEGECSEVRRHDDGLRQALLGGTALVALSETLALTHLSVGKDGTLTQVASVKLGGRGREACIAWAGPMLVAVTTGELSVRLWDLLTGDSHLLEPAYRNAGHAFTCLAAANGQLAAGTNLGGVHVWRCLDNEWTNETTAQVRGSAKQLRWHDNALLCNATSAVYLLQEQAPSCCVSSQMALMQVSARQVSVTLATGPALTLSTDLQVTGLAACADLVVARGNATLAVYQLIGQAFESLGSFPCRAQAAALIGPASLVVMETDGVTLRGLQGQVLQQLGGGQEEGRPITCEVGGSHATVATDNGILRLWLVGRREASLACPPKDLGAELADFGEVISARSDCHGTQVCVSVATAALVPDSRLVLWSVESNLLHTLDLASGLLDSVTPLCPPHLSGRFPLSFRWDQSEPSLLFCEAKLLPRPITDKALSEQRKASSATITLSPAPASLLIGLFATAGRGFSLSERSPLADGRRLAGVRAPWVFLLVGDRLERQPMGLLQGLEACQPDTRASVVAFGRWLSLGQADRAFAAIRNITDTLVWRCLATSCAGQGQLDAAALCLGRAGLARAARHLRLSRLHDDPQDGNHGDQMQLAAVAEQLGAPEEAGRIYRQAGRMDLLNRLLCAQGRWTEALAECAGGDRVRLRATHHACAKRMEAAGRLDEAARHFSLAGTAQRQVPRMLRDRPKELHAFLSTPEMAAWRGQYLESCGQLEDACLTYRACADHLSLVRVLCFQGRLDLAAEEASKSGHRAACYHVARQHEALDQSEQAVNFYTLAKAYGSAGRICMERNWPDQLWTLAQIGDAPMRRDAAAWFERAGDAGRAVALFHRAGAGERAVRLALASRDLDALDKMAATLQPGSALLAQCAETFVTEGRFQQAVALLAQAGEMEKAVCLCEKHNVLVTDQLANQLLPDTAKPANGKAAERPDAALLVRVAELSQSQGSFQLAARLLTRAGRKVEAMKALLKSGDTDKVIFFANVCRQREVYVMAANHLQALDWTSQPRILETIVSFYSKGRAPALLASFYEACARREADEFGDYEKALAALTEAQRCQPSQRTADSMALVKRFVDIRLSWRRGEREPIAGQCRQLLTGLPTDALVRRADVLAVLAEAALVAGDNEAARNAALEMGSAARHLLPPNVLASLRLPASQSQPAALGDEVEEQLE